MSVAARQTSTGPSPAATERRSPDPASGRRGPLGDAALGAVAGLAATWVMGKATTFLYRHEDEAARRREQDARGGSTAYVTAAERAAALAGMELDERQAGRYGSAIHWALGAGFGALYGVLRPRTGWASAGFGSLYGLLFFLLVDEGANTALGLTPAPPAFPWEAHARGLAGHVVYGMTTEAALALADAV